MQTINGRTADHPIEPLFLERWSGRAFSDVPLTDDEIMTLFEAARWAPSSFNVQPWRFLYAKRGTPAFATFLDLLVPFNQSWADKAALLVMVLSKTHMEAPGKPASPSYSHSFDAGAAWACLALQSARMGLFSHGMTGVDFPRAATTLKVPERYRVEAALAIGHPGDKETLPEGLRAREVPSTRLPLQETVFEGAFPEA